MSLPALQLIYIRISYVNCHRIYLLTKKNTRQQARHRKILTYVLQGGGFAGQRQSYRQSQHDHILNDTLEESRDIVREKEVGGGRDEDSTAVGRRNVATADVARSTLCVSNDWTYGRLDTESS